MPMKPCSSSYAKASKHQRDEPNCVNGWQLSIHWHMSVGGKGDALVIGENARISSICAAARSSTICMSWLVPKHFRLSFKLSLDYLTDALGRARLRKARINGHRFSHRSTSIN